MEDKIKSIHIVLSGVPGTEKKEEQKISKWLRIGHYVICASWVAHEKLYVTSSTMRLPTCSSTPSPNRFI